MKDHKDMKARLERELEELNRKGNWTASDLDNIKDITSSIKNLCRIAEMDEDGDEGGEYNRSRRMYYGYRRPMYPVSYAPDDGYNSTVDGYPVHDYSMYRGQPRDSMGRYSRQGGEEHMSREDILDDLRRLLPHANEKGRTALNNAIREFEQ